LENIKTKHETNQSLKTKTLADNVTKCHYEDNSQTLSLHHVHEKL